MGTLSTSNIWSTFCFLLSIGFLALQSKTVPVSYWLVCLGWTAVSFLRIVRLGWMLFLFERRASITTSQRSRASNPSIRSPASSEIPMDSVKSCETEVCFSHIQLTGTNVLLPKIHKTPPEVSLSPQGRQQNLSLGTNLVCGAVPCFAHDNVVGNRCVMNLRN